MSARRKNQKKISKIQKKNEKEGIETKCEKKSDRRGREDFIQVKMQTFQAKSLSFILGSCICLVQIFCKTANLLPTIS